MFIKDAPVFSLLIEVIREALVDVPLLFKESNQLTINLYLLVAVANSQSNTENSRLSDT